MRFTTGLLLCGAALAATLLLAHQALRSEVPCLTLAGRGPASPVDTNRRVTSPAAVEPPQAITRLSLPPSEARRPAPDELARLLGALERAPRSYRAAEAQRLLSLARRVGASMDVALKARLRELVFTLEPVSLRVVAGRALAATGPDTDLAGRLASRLRDAELDEETYGAICEALGGVGGAELVPEVLRAMAEGGSARTEPLARVLARLGGDEAAQCLLGLLSRSAEPEHRAVLEQACVDIEGEGFGAALSASIAGADPLAAASFVRVIARRKDTDQAEAVLATLDEAEDAVVREACVTALGMLATEPAIDRLVQLSRERGAGRDQALRVVAGLDAPAALDRVAASWGDLDLEGRRAVLQAASRQTQPSASLSEAARRAVSQTDPRLRAKALTVLGRRGDEADIARVAACIHVDEHSRVRRAAIEALGRLRTPTAARAALDRLRGLSVEEQQRHQPVFTAIVLADEGGRRRR